MCTKLNKFMRLGRGGVMVVVSALFILGASSDRSIEERQLEAQKYIDLINRGQQAYYSENGSFADRIDELGLHIVLEFDMPTETEDYSYRIKTLQEERVVIIAIPKSRDLKSYAGAAFLVKDGSFRTQRIICENDRPSQVPPAIARTKDGFICGLNSSPPVANLSIDEKQLEAQRYIAFINKAQQAYFAEYDDFADNLKALELGIGSETENYNYQIKTFEEKQVVAIAIPKFNDLKSYTGVVFVFVIPNEGYITKTILCESDRPSSTPPFTAWVGEEVKCVFGSSPLE